MIRFKSRKSDPVVQTDKGKVRGFLYEGVYNFQGVKYAKARRFHQPQPLDAWEGIADATSYGYISPVLSDPRPSGEVICAHRFWPNSETCLNMNIWTNSLDAAEKKPVIVWFHGGGYANGSAVEQVCYDGQNLARERGVVVVTVNHRLNVFGFLDLSDYGPEYENSGNCGIADLVAALTWIRNNIAGFGGNPDNVTIMGQSGGGGKVNTLGQTPAAAGLFHKAILLSGGMGGIDIGENPAPKNALPEAIMKEAGVSSIEELEKVPKGLFIHAVNVAGKKLEEQGYSFFWGPVENGWYLGEPEVVGVSDYYKTVPTLGGTVYSDLVPIGFEKDFDQYTDEEALEKVEERFGKENSPAVIEAFRAAYPQKRLIDLVPLDARIRQGARSYLMLKAKESSAPVWNMLTTLTFDYEGGTTSWHCADLPFVFGNSEKLPLYEGMGEVTERLKKQISAAICAFAATGNPNNPDTPAWEPVTADSLQTMVFDEESACKKDFDQDLDKKILAADQSPEFGGFSGFGNPDGESDNDWMF